MQGCWRLVLAPQDKRVLRNAVLCKLSWSEACSHLSCKMPVSHQMSSECHFLRCLYFCLSFERGTLLSDTVEMCPNSNTLFRKSHIMSWIQVTDAYSICIKNSIYIYIYIYKKIKINLIEKYFMTRMGLWSQTVWTWMKMWARCDS